VGTEVTVTVAETVSEVVLGLLGKLLGGLLDGLGQLLLTLGEANHAAGDALALTLTVATLTLVGGGVLGLVVVVLSFVKNKGASDNAVGAGEHDKGISVLVLSLGVPTALNLLDITNAALVDILVRVATVGTEGVEHFTSGLAAPLEVAELVDLEGVEAGLDALELTDQGGVVAGLLLKSDAAAGVRVAEEVELARGLDGLRLDLMLPVGVDGLSVVGLDVAGAVGAAAAPLERGVAVVRGSLVATVSGLVSGGSGLVAVVVVATPRLGLGFSLSGVGADHDDSAGSSGRLEHC